MTDPTDPTTDTDTMTEAETLVRKLPIDDDFAQRLTDAQHAYDEVKAYLDDLKDELRDRLKDEIGPGHRRIDGTSNGQVVFTYVRRTGTRLNGSMLKRDYPDIWQAYATTKATWYLTVSRDES